MRRGAVAEGAQHPAETRLHLPGRVAGDAESLDHDVRAMVADRARAQLHAVAHDVVLPSEDVQRIAVLQRLHPPLRHGKGVVAETDFAGLPVALVEREVDGPAKAEDILLHEAADRAGL